MPDWLHLEIRLEIVLLEALTWELATWELPCWSTRLACALQGLPSGSFNLSLCLQLALAPSYQPRWPWGWHGVLGSGIGWGSCRGCVESWAMDWAGNPKSGGLLRYTEKGCQVNGCGSVLCVRWWKVYSIKQKRQIAHLRKLVICNSLVMLVK